METTYSLCMYNMFFVLIYIYIYMLSIRKIESARYTQIQKPLWVLDAGPTKSVKLHIMTGHLDSLIKIIGYLDSSK